MISPLPVALSFCPNDTFLFYGWLEGVVGKKLPCLPHFADIEELNTLAQKLAFPLIKLSLSTYALLASSYTLLPIGTTLGFGCGPKLISKKQFPLDEMENCRVALPGKQTTAAFLFDHFFPRVKERRYVLYHEIEPLLQRGEVDAGVIIHESRFTFASKGLVELADLGKLFERKYHQPLPLGGLALRRDIPEREIVQILKDSLSYAQNHRKQAYAFAARFSQEKDLSIIQKHIELYVTKETEELSPQAMSSLNHFFSLVNHETPSLCHPS